MKYAAAFAVFILLLAVGSGAFAQDPTNGSTLYSTHCSGCHGNDGSGGSGPTLLSGCSICTDYSQLQPKIENDMPQTSPGTCTGTCADDTAAHIIVNLNNDTLVIPTVGEVGLMALALMLMIAAYVYLHRPANIRMRR